MDNPLISLNLLSSFSKGISANRMEDSRKSLQQVVLKGREADYCTSRRAYWKTWILKHFAIKTEELLGHPSTIQEALAYALYPKVFEEYSVMNKGIRKYFGH